MYHIKNDKRSRSSALQIVKGLQECLKTIPLKRVTVSDIHRVTGISRATFYRLFDNPDDVLHYQFQLMVEATKEVEVQEGLASVQRLEQVISLGMEYHEFIKALVDNRRFDLLYEYTEQNFRRMDSVQALFPREMESVEREYVISQFSMSMVAALITWARNGRRESAAEIAGYLRSYTRVLTEVTKQIEPEQQV